MAYHNPHSIGYQVESCLNCGSYNVNSHGDIGAHYNSIFNVDLPEYAARKFYHQSENDVFSDIKYNKLGVGYDAGLRDVRDSLQGPPIEAYIPRSVVVPDNASASPSVIIRNTEVMPKKSVVDEILKAQAEVVGKKPIRILIKTTEVEEEIHLRRKFKKVEISGTDNSDDRNLS